MPPDSNANETVWEYDEAGRQVRKVYDNGDTILMEYDLKGRLTKRTDPNGAVSLYSYDNRDLLTQRTYGAAGVQTFAYDILRRMTQGTDNNGGALPVVRDTTYDALGRVLTEAQTIGALPTRTTVNTWDAAGRKLTCTHPSGRVVRYAWTKLHQPDTIETDTGAGFEVICDYDYQYDSPGNGDKRPVLQTKTLHAGTGVAAHYTHDSVGRHLLLDWRDGANATLVGFDRSYDLHGNPTAETHLHHTPDNEAFTHDTAQRLAAYDRGNGVFTQAWTLDDLGNWVQFDDDGTVQDRTHNTANQLTAIVNGPTFAYDNNGNLVADGTLTYVWDALDRLASVVNGIGPVANYFYDARNMRVLKDVDTDADGVPDTQTSFHYDDMIVVEERDENDGGALLKSYVHGKQYMHELLMQSTSATALGEFYLHSHIWNVHALVDTSGNVVERYKYEAYGKRSVFDASFTPRAMSLYAQRFGRTGHYLDPETAMVYYGYRYYAPELGRWLSRDPIEEGDGWNLYAFVRGCPVNHFDLLGHFSATLPLPPPPSEIPVPVEPHPSPGPVTGKQKCCGDQPFDPKTECCKKKDGRFHIFKKGTLKGTGYYSCVRYSSSAGLHAYLKFEDSAWSFVPTGNPLSSPGIVVPETTMGGTCTQRVIFPCKIDLEGLKKCIASRIAEDVATPPYYGILYFNCFWWVHDVYWDCYGKAKW